MLVGSIIFNVILFASVIILFIKLSSMKTAVKKLYDANIKNGFYEISTYHYSSSVYNIIIEVIELERFINGYSRVKMNKYRVKGGSSTYEQELKDNFIKKFEPLVLTKDITWLESKSEFIENRRKKLKRIIGLK